jgi:hypothetical protein
MSIDGPVILPQPIDRDKEARAKAEDLTTWRRNAQNEQAQQAGRFGLQAERGYAQLGREATTQRANLRMLATGQNSVSAMQLRQGLQQNLAAQRSLAAGAAPQNQAMAARTAAIQSGRLGAGMAGQQAVAGLQERQGANQQLGQLILQQRAQDQQVALGAGGQAMQGLDDRGVPGAPSWWQENGPAIQAGATAAAAIWSDRRLKTDVKDGDESADKMLNALRSFTYRYKDERHGVGERTGVMAQDLERAGIKHAVIDTPGGKMVHGGHLATANTSMLVALRKRVEKIEKGRA